METTASTGVVPTGQDQAGGRPQILVVDGSVPIGMELLRTFESVNCSVTLCKTLAAARAVLAQRTFSLVLLDARLRDGDGIELLRQIKSSAPVALPVILLSTEAEASDRLRGLKAGADDFIPKPYDATYVRARALELMGWSADPAKPASPGLLLIDDSANSRQNLKSILESAGYRVVIAATSEDGLRAAFAFRPEAIIVSSVAPGGLDADMVVQRLKQDVMLRNIPCLLLTAASEDGEELRALDAGVDACLGEEADPDVLLARLAALIRTGSHAPAVEPLGSGCQAPKRYWSWTRALPICKSCWRSYIAKAMMSCRRPQATRPSNCWG
jgi:two-component system NtrC family sensor kinase